MGKAENININLVITDTKTYNLECTDEAINFLVFMLNGKYFHMFIDFSLTHIGLNINKYRRQIIDNESKSLFEIQNDVNPFFDFFWIDFYEDNVFYKYIYTSNDSDFIKKQKINTIIDGLRKTLDYYFDFHCVDIFHNAQEEKDYNFIDKIRRTEEFCGAYIYFAICQKLISFYDYLYDEFYTFIDTKNTFDYKYSHRIKEVLKNNPETNTTSKILNRNEILEILFKKDIVSQEKFIKYEDKLIIHQFLNVDKSKWLKSSATFIRFYIHCEKKLLRKGVYENNIKGVSYFRDLYDFKIGKSIDFPSKRKIQITKLTKNEFNFLDI
jgi:hypothetical protein